MLKFKHILCPTDFSDYSARALKFACSLADRYAAALHLLHVLPDPSTTISTYGPIAGYLPDNWMTGMTERADLELKKLPSRTIAAKLKVTRAITQGTTYFEIIRYAEEHHIDLIVIGTGTALNHALMGSVAEKIVRRAPCPVMLIHPQDL
jgi:nucleotide-binding universal stress UspA family protein